MEDIKKMVIESFSINDLCIKLYGYCNGRTIKKIKKVIEENSIDISHFGQGKKNMKYKRIIKICPICEKEFETSIGDRDEKTTCSNRCGNLYFQHGKNNPNFDEIKYKERYNKVSKSLISKQDFNNKKVKDIKIKIPKIKDIKIKIPKIKDIEKRYCKYCNKDITNKPKVNIYCSNRCRSMIPISDETKNKIKNSIKERIKNGTHKGWASRIIESYPEKFFKKVLIDYNIEFEFNKPVKKKDLGINCGCSYFLDFYIKNVNIDLEIDGSQHRYRKDHDELRDKSLVENGFDVYRIKWKNINTNNGKEYIKNEIDNFVKYYNNKLGYSTNG